MPAAAPAIAAADQENLVRLGQRLRQLRKDQRVSAVAAAQAAGMSRVTLHRIEKGEPSVAIGAWAALASALGVRLDLADPSPGTDSADSVAVPQRIRLQDYPQLQALAWQLHDVEELGPRQALQLYERNWRHLDLAQMSQAEHALVRALTQALGGGRLLV